MMSENQNHQNLDIWNRVEKTNPDMTKKFKRQGGFSGTSVDPLWNIKRATELWGSMGKNWGAKETETKIVQSV